MEMGRFVRNVLHEFSGGMMVGCLTVGSDEKK